MNDKMWCYHKIGEKGWYVNDRGTEESFNKISKEIDKERTDYLFYGIKPKWMKEKYEFKSLDSFEIKDRGTVFVVEAKEEGTSKDYLDIEVTIDGKLYRSIGVECFYPKISKGEKIGILTNELK